MKEGSELRSLCDMAGRQAGGSVTSWTQARAAELARSRRRRLGIVTLAVGAGLLTAGVLAAQFRDPPAPAVVVQVPPSMPAVAEAPAPVVSVPPAAAPVAAGSMAARLQPSPAAVEPVVVQPADAAASAPDNSESQPDGSC